MVTNANASHQPAAVHSHSVRSLLTPYTSQLLYTLTLDRLTPYPSQLLYTLISGSVNSLLQPAAVLYTSLLVHSHSGSANSLHQLLYTLTLDWLLLTSTSCWTLSLGSANSLQPASMLTLSRSDHWLTPYTSQLCTALWIGVHQELLVRSRVRVYSSWLV